MSNALGKRNHDERPPSSSSVSSASSGLPSPFFQRDSASPFDNLSSAMSKDLPSSGDELAATQSGPRRSSDSDLVLLEGKTAEGKTAEGEDGEEGVEEGGGDDSSDDEGGEYVQPSSDDNSSDDDGGGKEQKWKGTSDYVKKQITDGSHNFGKDFGKCVNRLNVMVKSKKAGMSRQTKNGTFFALPLTKEQLNKYDWYKNASQDLKATMEFMSFQTLIITVPKMARELGYTPTTKQNAVQKMNGKLQNFHYKIIWPSIVNMARSGVSKGGLFRLSELTEVNAISKSSTLPNWDTNKFAYVTFLYKPDKVPLLIGHLEKKMGYPIPNLSRSRK